MVVEIHFKLRRLKRREINVVPDLTLGLVHINDLIRSTAKTGLWAIKMLYQCSFIRLITALWQFQRTSFLGTIAEMKYRWLNGNDVWNLLSNDSANKKEGRAQMIKQMECVVQN